VTTGFLVAGLVAVGIAGILSLALSQRILSPIQSLTNATLQMQAGDLSQRVVVTGDDEIGKLGSTFNAMASSLQQQEQLRRNMVSDIAHELRTPLSNIRGYLEAVQDGVIDPNRATIDSLHEEAMLLNYLIEDLQELSLAEAGQLRIMVRPMDVVEVVESAVAGLKMPASSKNITLTTNLPSNLPIVQADPERMGQVLRNVIKNAILYTENAGKITITAQAEPTGVSIAVADTGRGIAPEHIPYLFDRFYRADESRNRATGGTGLGLAITKAIVDLHHGDIFVDSIVGVGTTFKIFLPQT
jgi:signal transduction histidine kinase